MLRFGRWIVSGIVLFLIGCGQDVKMVELEPTSIDLRKATQSRKLEVKAMDIRDAEIENVAFTYSSNNTAVATVDSRGIVKPAGNGNTVIVAKAPNGTTGETFVKVCLPKELVCEPKDLLELKEGLAAPIKCHVTNCEDAEIRGAPIVYAAASREMLLKEGQNIFIGLKTGDSSVNVTAFDLSHTVKVRIDEQTYLPGMGPDASGGGGGGGGRKQDEDPYGKSQFDHILKNMKFK